MADNEDVSCGYCLEDSKTMTDPRKLPCGHIFCLPCLKGNTDSGTLGVAGHRCTTCRHVHKIPSPDSLPTALTKAKDENEDNKKVSVPTPKCDRCSPKKWKKAVRYCVDCGEKSCAEHIKHHHGYFEDLHQTVDILDYCQTPNLYNKAMTCSTHKKEIITMACEKCYTFNCIQCHSAKSAYPCPGLYQPASHHPMRIGVIESEEHVYQPLEEINKQLKNHFDDLVTESHNKLSEISRRKKQSSNDLDNVTEKCKEMVAELEKKSMEQITLIRMQTTEIKVKIQRYEMQKTNELVTYHTDLSKKEEEINGLWTATHKFARESSLIEMIERKEEKTNGLTAANNKPLEIFDTSNHLRIGKKRRLEIDFHESSEFKIARETFGDNWRSINNFFNKEERWN